MAYQLLLLGVFVAFYVSSSQAIVNPVKGNDSAVRRFLSGLDIFTNAIPTYPHVGLNEEVPDRAAVPYSGDTHALCDLHAQSVCSLVSIFFFYYLLTMISGSSVVISLVWYCRRFIVGSGWDIVSVVPAKEDIYATTFPPNNFGRGAWVPCGLLYNDRDLRSHMTPQNEPAGTPFVYKKVFLDEGVFFFC